MVFVVRVAWAGSQGASSRAARAVDNLIRKQELACFHRKDNTPDRTPQVRCYRSCLIGTIGMSLSDKSMLFCSGKSRNVGCNHEKVCNPLHKIFTPFWARDVKNSIFKFSNFPDFRDVKRGVKNFLVG